MCLDPTDPDIRKNYSNVLRNHGGHWCFRGCPICWTFINWPILSQEQCHEITTAGALWVTQQIGCKSAALLGEWVVQAAKSVESSGVAYEAPLSVQLQHNVATGYQEIRLTVKDKIGPQRPAPWLREGYTIQEDNSFELPFTAFTTDDDSAAKFITRRPANPIPTSTNSIKAIQDWIHECTTSHPNCPTAELTDDMVLPAQVINLDLKNHNIRLRKTADLGMEQPVTTRDNVEARYSSLLASELPQTIKDAMWVAGNLHIPYLWVDSLCILQDSREDKATKIVKMANIYKHATITIAAGTAAKCDEGFLQPQAEVLKILASSPELPFRTPEFDNEPSETHQKEKGLFSKLKAKMKRNTEPEYVYGKVYLSLDPTVGHNLSPATGHFLPTPISSRAWTLQEEWLSPRLLFYGHGPPQWKCLSSRKTKGYDHWGRLLSSLATEYRSRFFIPQGQGTRPPDSNGEDNGRESPNSMSTDEDIIRKLERMHVEHPLSAAWRELVEGYTARAMAVPSNKLPAISAGDTVDYGLSLPFEYRVPSWSWAAVDGKVNFKAKATLGIMTRPYEQPQELVIHSCSATLKDPTVPFGEVTGGRLEISGKVNTMDWRQMRDRFNVYGGLTPDFFDDYIVLDGGMGNSLWDEVLRDAKDEMAEDDEALTRKYEFLEMCKNGPQGILLVRCGDNDVWSAKGMEKDANEGVLHKRVGYWRLGSQTDIGHEGIETKLRGNKSREPRNWDWEEGLLIKKLVIV
ncbi:heterokaryon incompatibility protein-domain-containing protein [Clohesyomyces aquaticus]|uniref:Heterokaryon incompatibility protein-domain-containing protein n=1 Tax=Clohesyomyces aquaticus TaxID=1231657 RepID=A0A1Y2A8E1_9PLEO|nr:heterokaryon incompatibility protein-domain-containing protein [Clohesyomyces aquaticus]